MSKSIKTKKKTIKINKQTDSTFRKTILPNGLTVLSEIVPGSQSFALGFAIKAGSQNDPIGKEGIAHFFEHIAFRRTRNKTGKRIAHEFETMGAYINAYTTKELTFFYVRALNKHLSKCLELLSEVVFHPALRENDIEKESEIILEEISSYDDDPEELIFDIGEAAVFKGSRLEHPIPGLSESVKRINSKELQTFHDKYYNPSNVILSYTGVSEHEEILNLATNLDIKISKKAKEILFHISPEKPKIIRKDGQFQQSHLLYILRTEGFASADRYPLGIINIILGDGLSSRLNQLLREKHGLVYSIYSTLSLLADTGTFGIYAASENKKLTRIEEMITKELENIIKDGFSDREIVKAKEQLKSSTIMALEGLSERMQSNARDELATGEYESMEETVRIVDSITKEKVEEITKKYLASTNWSEVILKGNK